MALADLIPGMDDTQLKTLRANAVRLQTEGDTAKQAAATEILPVIDGEMAERAAKNPKLAPKPRAKRKTAAPKAEAADKPAKAAKAEKPAKAARTTKAAKAEQAEPAV